jgi:putative methyltransferase (TIGR04325 family)
MKTFKLEKLLTATKAAMSPGRRKEIHFTGDYASWEEALKASDNYDAGVILEKTRAAALKVKRGEAAYERDSVLFDQVEHSFPVLAGLLRAAVGHDSRLCVLDFGGALGSTYFQCRNFLQPLHRLEWCIVEQPAHVACGKQDFESRELHFYSSVEECLAAHRPDVLLLSAVLHYLPKPYDTLRALVQWGIPSIIIDCTPLLAGDRDRLTVQHVPATIYAASYPAWFLSQTKLTGVILAAGYRLLADFEAAKLPSPPGEKACCKGFIFEKKSAHD